MLVEPGDVVVDVVEVVLECGLAQKSVNGVHRLGRVVPAVPAPPLPPSPPAQPEIIGAAGALASGPSPKVKNAPAPAPKPIALAGRRAFAFRV
jgi:hypothetical protein